MQITLSFSLLVINSDIHLIKHQPTPSKSFQHLLQLKIDHLLHLICLLQNEWVKMVMLSAQISLCRLVCILYCVPKLTPENGKKKYPYVNEIYPLIVITKAEIN